MTAAWCPPESLPMLWNFLKSQTRTLSAAAEKRLRPLGLSAMSVTAVSPVGMAKVRLAETNWTGPFVVRPLDDKVFTHVVLLIRKSHTFIKAEDTVKAILVASEYLTQTTLLGWPPRLSTSSFRHKSHTLTVRSLDALNSNSSVA